ncbi:uncharacterized protein LOC134658641 [Cydia amplana]|uniref:uncharacterized protein LOC134658641 n=1 Tax=Cydia amplana TaxID=1869771 RepID=UPI002FE5CF76
MKVQCDSENIDSLRRLGKRTDKCRPVLVTFTTAKKKIELLKRKKMLAATGYYINEDFPQQVLNKRKELQKQAEEERKKGNFAILKYDKLVILPGNSNSKMYTPKPNNKRTLSNSPEITPTSDNIGSTGRTTTQQISKKNKYDIKRFLHDSTSNKDQ